MILNIILPLSGLFGIYYTFHSLIAFVTNKTLLLFCTILTILVQTLFVEQFFSYKTYSNTEYKFVHYTFPLLKKYITKN